MSKNFLITTISIILFSTSVFACGNITEAKKAELIKYGNYFGAKYVLAQN